MPSIQGNHNGKAAIIMVAIIDCARYEAYKETGTPILTGVTPLRALVDTGASKTMIATHVAAQLGLQPVNKLQFGGLGGVTWRPGYLFHVAFYAETPDASNAPSKIHIYRRIINGGELSDEHTFDVLLGMDLLTTGKLIIDRNGTFSFSF